MEKDIVDAVFPRDKFPSLAGFTGLDTIPAVRDQKVGSPVVNALNQSLADQAIPRANVMARIPARDAAIRVALSAQDRDYDFPKTIKNRDRAIKAFRLCKTLSYATIVASPLARKCSYGIAALNSIDNKWLEFVNGADTVHVFGANLLLPRNVDFDGVVSNERSQYPGLTDGLLKPPAVYPANHQNVYKLKSGLGTVADVMLRIGMRAPVPPLAAGLSGPSVFQSSATLTWTVTATGAKTPYTYQWSYRPSSSSIWTSMSSTTNSASRSVTTLTSSFAIRVVVTSADGQAVTTSLPVTNTYSRDTCGGGIAC